jgi:hypothetical protein
MGSPKPRRVLGGLVPDLPVLFGRQSLRLTRTMMLSDPDERLTRNRYVNICLLGACLCVGVPTTALSIAYIIHS